MHPPVYQPSPVTYLGDESPPLALYDPDKSSFFEPVFTGSTHVIGIVLESFAVHWHAASLRTNLRSMMLSTHADEGQYAIIWRDESPENSNERRDRRPHTQDIIINH
jgi:hypothetical protein